MPEPIARRLREAGFLLLLAVAGFVLLALLTFHPTDPGWSYHGATSAAMNVGGTAGAWLADVLLSLLGLTAYLVPFILLGSAWLLLRDQVDDGHEGYHVMVVRWVGFVLTVAAGSALLAIHLDEGLWALPQGPGGILGQVLSGVMSHLGGPRAGGSLLLVAGLLVGVTLFSGLSWFAVMDWIGGMTLAGARHSAVFIGWLREREQRRRARQERAEVVEETKQRVSRLPAPRIEPSLPEVRASVRVEQERQITLLEPDSDTDLPPLGLLDAPVASGNALSDDALQAMGQLVELKLADFGISAHVTAIHPGPVVTLFELQLSPGTKVSKVTNLSKDLARSLSTVAVRVVEVIAGKSVIGLEIPNEQRETVYLSEVLRSEAYDRARSVLSLALGKDIAGAPVIADLARMPHLLIAGTTGSGKSVAINAMLLSLLYKAKATEVRLILIDPKMLELSVYEGIPHLLTPVVTDMKEAANALRWCVAEMERRYRLMAALGVRNITGYNRKIVNAREAGEPLCDPLFEPDPAAFDGELQEAPELDNMPYIVVIIDELADMMMVVGKKVEELIARLAQKARAAGIHLILATQRPSVDVITGLIKANIPSRVAFQVSSRVDSRTILDQMGAEQLLGHGDMLYLPPGTGFPQRIHGAFVSDDEVHRVADHLKRAGRPDYVDEILQEPTEPIPGLSAETSGIDVEDADPLFDEAVQIVVESRRASISGVQRRLKIGYNRAARLVEEMQRIGLVSAPDNKGNREVLAPPGAE